MTTYRVVDTRPGAPIKPGITVEARSPETAAKSALDLDLVRAGPKRNLAARVYWTNQGQPMTMVRLYHPAIESLRWATADRLQE